MSRVIDIRGTDEAKELLDSLSDQDLQNRVRRGTRAGAAVFRREVRARAKSQAGIPDTFAKTATKGHRTPVGTSTGPTSPLLNIFEEGAGAHTIAPGYSGTSVGSPTRAARAGRFTGSLLLSGRGGERWRSRDMVADGPVRHPGMAARPFIGPIFDAKEDEASEAAMDVLMAGIR